MTPPAPTALIFDIGNVLVTFDFDVAVRRLQHQCGKKITFDIIQQTTVDYEKGLMSSDEFLSRITTLLEYTGLPHDLASAWQEIFTENRPMTSLAKRLSKHYPLYLLSNTSDLHIDHIFRTFPIFHSFRDAVYSYKAGLVKPDPAIFELAARQFNVNPAETLYIDDLAPNVAAAARAGFQAHQYDHTRHADFEATLERLQLKGL